MKLQTLSRALLELALCLALALAGSAAPVRADRGFEPGELVLVRRQGELVEGRVVKQDASGVLVAYPDARDGQYHSDGFREYRQPSDLRRAQSRTAPGSGELQAGRGGALPKKRGAAPAEPARGVPARRAANPRAEREPEPAAAGGGGSAVPDGEYGCYTYHPAAVYVGGLVISGQSYRSKTGASGRYRLSAGGRVDWLGSPPLGFGVAVLEQVQPYATLRMYAQAADIGNKWKAALCAQKSSSAAGSKAGGGGAGAGGGASWTVRANARTPPMNPDEPIDSGPDAATA